MSDFTYHPETATTVSSTEMAQHVDLLNSAADRVVSGYNALTSPAALSVTIEPGFAYVSGYRVGDDPDGNVAKPLAPGTTNYVFLSKFGALEVNTSGSPAEAESVKLWEIVTNGSGTTSKTDFRSATVFFQTGFKANGIESAGNVTADNLKLRAATPFVELLDQTSGGSTFRFWSRNNQIQVTDASGSKVFVNNLADLSENLIENVKDVNLNTPPGSPAVGDRYIVGPAPTGAWNGNANRLAEWNGTIWKFIVIPEGGLAYDVVEDVYYLFNGTIWDYLVKGDVNVSANTLAQRTASGAVNVADATAATHAVNRQFGDGRYINVTGDTMTGGLDFGGTQKVTGLAAPTAANDATRKVYVDDAVNAQSAASVNDGDAAGGDLTGTYPNPTIGNDKVTTAKIANSGVTTAKIAANNVDNTKLTDMGAATVKGRANGAGTGDPQDLTNTQLLDIVKTVDGVGSGLDSDLLDGLQGGDGGSYYVSNDAVIGDTSDWDTFTDAGAYKAQSFSGSANEPPTSYAFGILTVDRARADGENRIVQTFIPHTTDSNMYVRVSNNGTWTSWKVLPLTTTGQTVWTSENDGAGSGLDADKVDGAEPSTAPAANLLPKYDGSGIIESNYPQGGKDVLNSEFSEFHGIGVHPSFNATPYLSQEPFDGIAGVQAAGYLSSIDIKGDTILIYGRNNSGRPYIAYSLDDGDSWTTRQLPATWSDASGNHYHSKVHIVNNNTFHVIGVVYGGSTFGAAWRLAFMKTTDSGVTWSTPVDINPGNTAWTATQHRVFDAHWVDDNIIWVVSTESTQGRISLSTNGGANWTYQVNAVPAPNAQTVCIHATSASNAVVGWRDTGSATTPHYVAKTTTGVGGFSNILVAGAIHSQYTYSAPFDCSIYWDETDQIIVFALSTGNSGGGNTRDALNVFVSLDNGATWKRNDIGSSGTVGNWAVNGGSFKYNGRYYVVLNKDGEWAPYEVNQQSGTVSPTTFGITIGDNDGYPNMVAADPANDRFGLVFWSGTSVIARRISGSAPG